MHEDTTIPFPHQQLLTEDSFTEVVRQGAQRLLAQVIEAEVAMWSCRAHVRQIRIGSKHAMISP
jgi:hypothetical protein